MDIDTQKLKQLENKVSLLIKNNNITEFNKLLKSDLNPTYLFINQSNSPYNLYKNYQSIFIDICTSGNLDFVKSSIEKSCFSEEDNYLIAMATASGFIKASEMDNLEMVKYLISVDTKYQKIIDKDDGINHTSTIFDQGKKLLIYDVLDESVTQSLYKDTKPNLELIEYLFFSSELKNHPRIKFEDLVQIFITDNLDLFDKLLDKALNEKFDILDLFKKSSLSLHSQKENLIKLAKYIIHDFKVCEYPGVADKISQEPFLNTLYFMEQLDNSLENKNGVVEKIKKLKI